MIFDRIRNVWVCNTKGFSSTRITHGSGVTTMYAAKKVSEGSDAISPKKESTSRKPTVFEVELNNIKGSNIDNVFKAALNKVSRGSEDTRKILMTSVQLSELSRRINSYRGILPDHVRRVFDDWLEFDEGQVSRLSPSSIDWNGILPFAERTPAESSSEERSRVISSEFTKGYVPDTAKIKSFGDLQKAMSEVMALNASQKESWVTEAPDKESVGLKVGLEDRSTPSVLLSSKPVASVSLVGKKELYNKFYSSKSDLYVLRLFSLQDEKICPTRIRLLIQFLLNVDVYGAIDAIESIGDSTNDFRLTEDDAALEVMLDEFQRFFKSRPDSADRIRVLVRDALNEIGEPLFEDAFISGLFERGINNTIQTETDVFARFRSGVLQSITEKGEILRNLGAKYSDVPAGLREHLQEHAQKKSRVKVNMNSITENVKLVKNDTERKSFNSGLPELRNTMLALASSEWTIIFSNVNDFVSPAAAKAIDDIVMKAPTYEKFALSDRQTAKQELLIMAASGVRDEILKMYPNLPLRTKLPAELRTRLAEIARARNNKAILAKYQEFLTDKQIDDITLTRVT